MAAIREVGTLAGSFDGSNVSPAIPAATQDGDLMLLLSASREASGGMPAGWTALAGFPVGAVPFAMAGYRVKQAGDSDPTIVVAGRSLAAVIMSVYQFDPDDPVNAPAGPVSGSGTTITTNDLTAAERNELAFFVGFSASSSPARATASGYSGSDPALTEILDDGVAGSSGGDSNASIAIATGVTGSPGALGARTATLSVSRSHTGVLFSIPPKRLNPIVMIV